jgi:diguanylate cyclase (GGDEF)-like protein
MTVLRADQIVRVDVASRDPELGVTLARCLRTANSAPSPGAAITLAGGSETHIDAEVLLVEIGGETGLDLFREMRDRYPEHTLVVCAWSQDTELPDVATHHGADDIIFREELGPVPLRRVISAAVERKAMTRQLIAAREREAQLATHDSVTGLANRSLLFTCTGQAITFAKRQNSGLAVIVFDIRGLQSLNERFGYRAGDCALNTVAERILDSIRTSYMAGRLGGDVFVVLLRDVISPGGAGKAVENILNEIARPLYVSGHRTTIESRAGIAFCPVDGTDAERLVTLAHAALDVARRKGLGYEYAPPWGNVSNA